MDGIVGTLAGTILGALIAFVGSRLGLLRVFVYRIAFGPVVSIPGDMPQTSCQLNESDEIIVHLEILYSSTKNIPTSVFDPFFEIRTEKGITERFPLAKREKLEASIGSIPFLDPIRAISLGVREVKHFFFEIIISREDIVDSIKSSPNAIRAYIGHRHDVFMLPQKLIWKKRRIRKYILCERQNDIKGIPKETLIRI